MPCSEALNTCVRDNPTLLASFILVLSNVKLTAIFAPWCPRYYIICPVQHKITQKEQKETTKKGGISLTIMGQRQTYNSIHKPQLSPNETLGLNQDDHPYRMCNETGIPMVMMVMSRTCSLHNPTQQDFINVRTLPIYKCHTCFKF